MTKKYGPAFSGRALCACTSLLLALACADDDAAGSRVATASTRSDAGRDHAIDAGAHTSHTDASSSNADHTQEPASHHASCAAPYAKDPRDDTMTGELVRVKTGDNGTPDDPSDDPYDVLLPQEMLDWLAEQNWIQEHGDWHNTRRCKQGCMRTTPGGFCQSSESLAARGLECAPIQEGEPGDGYAFLVMHRHMIRGFKQAFPKHVEAIRSFYEIPASKSDPENPIPWVDVRWSDDQKQTVQWLEEIVQHMDAFASEDDYAKWVQFGDHQFAGPPPGGFPDGGMFDPGNFFPGGPPPQSAADGGVPSFPNAGSPADTDGGTSDRPGGGVHGALHGQWTVRGSSSVLTDNNKNVQNFAFWRLHGWIDDMWERYRVAAGLSEYDAEYQQALIDQCEEMHALGKAGPLTDDPLTMQPATQPESGMFASEVAPIFNAYCGGSVCHDAQSPTLGVALAGTAASIVREGLVGQRASEYEMALIEPGKPDQSWLYRKLTENFSGINCSRATCTGMPLAGMKPTADELDRIKRWIDNGATAD